MGKGQEFWVGERVERLSQLWAQGKSDSKIAALLSIEWAKDISRCAIIGARHRHLSKDNRKVMVSGKPVMTRPSKPKRPRAVSAGAREAMRKIIERPPVPRLGNLLGPQSDFSLDVPGMQCEEVTLYALTDAICHWPLDNGSYCGNARADDHKSYCRYHAALATRRY